MPQNGSLVVRVFVSRAQLPISGATVIVSRTAENGKQQLLSIAQTNESGMTEPLILEAPNKSASESPSSGSAPNATYNLVVEHPDYQLSLFDQLQIFPGVQTVQDVPMIPLSENTEENPSLSTVTPQPL